MPLASSPTKSTSRSKLRKSKPAAWTGGGPVVAEINAYIAIRNDLLAEAERMKTHAKLDSAAVANDFVQNCLKPARPPYEWQCLPEADSALERKRCEAVERRIAELRRQTTP
jgi:hypothetical protein